MMGILRGNTGSGEFTRVREKVILFSRPVLPISPSFSDSLNLSVLEPKFYGAA